MHRVALALVLVAGCGEDMPQEGPPDASSAVDAANPPPRPVDATCEGDVREVTDPNGTRTRTIRFYARVDVGDPRTFPSFRVLTCDRETSPTSGDLAAFDCTLADGTGTFAEGKLLVYCGFETWVAEPGREFVKADYDRYRTVQVMRK